MTAAPTTHELYEAAFAPRPDLDAADRRRLGGNALGTDLLALLAALWLLAAPVVLGYGTTERGSAGFWNAVATGALLALLALVRAGHPTGALSLRAAGVILGGWLVLAPAVLGAATVGWPVVNEVGVGLATILVAAAGFVAAMLARRLRR
ncbi:MAG TPA: SPW repeat protein [Mycobacteriales bacterium]